MPHTITKVVQLLCSSTAYICCVVLRTFHVLKWSMEVSGKNLNMPWIRNELRLIDMELRFAI